MESLFPELARQIPAAAAVIGVVYLFLRHESETDKRREENARQIALERKQHELALNTLWADRFNHVVEAMRKSYEAIQDDIRQHDETSEERYKRLQITKDLLREAGRKPQPPK